MKISGYAAANTASIKSALNIATLRMSMQQDAQSVNTLVKAMEKSVTPHKGGSIDLKL